jgi:hypothetical protein
VDWSRTTYRTSARLISGSDQLFDIVWYPAAPGALPLGFPCAIDVLNWNDQPWADNTIGEDWGAPRVFERREALDYLGQGESCGDPAWFLSGQPDDIPNPNTEYNEDNIPLCCTDVADLVFPLRILLELEAAPDEPQSWNCDESRVLTVPESWAGSVPAGGQQFWQFAGVAGQAYRLTFVTDSTELGATISVGEDACDTVFVPVIAGGPDCVWFTAANTNTYHVLIANPGAVVASYSASVELGPCDEPPP